MTEILSMVFGLVMFFGVAFHEPICDLLYALSDWLRNRRKQ